VEIVWCIGDIDRQFIIEAFGCRTEAELKQLLDTTYDRVATDLKAQNSRKPVFKFVPLIRRIETYEPDTGQLQVYEDNGNCLPKKGEILIAANPRMKVAVIHEIVHWLRRDLTEKEARRATDELVKLWRLTLY